VRVSRGRPLLGRAGRIWACWLFAACVVVVVVLGAVFAGQTRADGFDDAVDSPFIRFFAGHNDLLLRLAFPGTLVPAIVISVVVAGCCLLAGRLNGAVLALTTVPAATALDDELLKRVFDRTYLGALSFPSGHTTSIVSLTAMLALLLLVPPRPRRARAARAARAAGAARVLVVAAGCAISAVVASAVIGLRWHYFTDTVAGAAVGIGTVCALALILDLVLFHNPRRSAVATIQASTRASSRQAS
jgi:membrane-associated phospholipid phosphatase